MLTPEQLELRRQGITSTDITRIVGESPWGGPPDVYADKISEAPAKLPTLYQRIGHALEPLVCELIAEQFHVALRRSTTLVHPAERWRMSTPDRVGKGCVAEAKVKSVSFQRAQEWLDDEPPAFVTVQATWHMIVKRVPVCYVGALLGASPRFYVVEYDDSLAQVLVEEGERFWKTHVLPGVPPPVDGSAGAKRMIRAAWPKNKGAMIKAGSQVEALARDYFAAHDELKVLEKRQEIRAQTLQVIIGEADGLQGDGWRALFKERAGYELPAKRVEAHRHWDMRRVSK